jgi:glycosyltransferase involved in cell wall biosynthesis
MIISFFKRTRFVFEVRDLWPESAIDAGVLKNKLIIRLSFWLESRIYNKATKINVLTPAFREKLIHQKKILPEKIIYIPNGADFSQAEYVSDTFSKTKFRKDHDLPDDDFILIYVGAHGLVNGLDLVLETAQHLQNAPVLFLLIGTGMEKRRLQEQVVSKNILNVRFLDPVPKSEVYKYILASDAGISILIKADTFKTIYSNKTFDYMSCKKPILMAIDGVSKDLVETADCGLFVEPDSSEDFTRKIRIYLKDRALSKKHGENGYAFAKKHFNRKDLAQEYLEELEKIVKRKGQK